MLILALLPYLGLENLTRLTDRRHNGNRCRQQCCRLVRVYTCAPHLSRLGKPHTAHGPTLTLVTLYDASLGLQAVRARPPRPQR